MLKIVAFAFIAVALHQGTVQANTEEPTAGTVIYGQPPSTLNMNTQCNIKGECKGQLVDFKVCRGVAECLLYCKLDAACKWWTWDDPKQLCLLFEDCDERPTGKRCPKCVSGQRSCEFRQDEIPASCMDRIIESTSKVSLDECADACSGVEECAFYVFDPKDDGSPDCTLFKSCLHMHQN